MKSLTFELKEFIENNIELIENNQFTELYDAFAQEVSDKLQTIDLTIVLTTADINPLKHMQKVPLRYCYGGIIDDLIIPNNIRIIDALAFSTTDLTKVIIPEGVEEIRTRAFSSCMQLKEVHLPSTITYLANSVFARCYNLKTVFYNGTVDEWKKLDKYDAWISGARNIGVTVVCTDGEVFEK